MGVYAECYVEITCRDHASAKVAQETLVKKMEEMKDKDMAEGAYYINLDELDEECAVITGRMSSGRVQNLDYQVEQVWETVKPVDGVEELSGNVMVEGDSIYYSKEDEE